MNHLRTLLCCCAVLAALAGGVQAQDCPNNLVTNGGFTDGLVGGSMPAATVTGWSLLTNSPQVLYPQGCAAPGSIAMWGNGIVGESLKQNLPGVGIEAGQEYTVSVCYTFYDNNPILPQYVRFRLAASAGMPTGYPPTAGYTVIGITPNTSSTSWTTYTFPNWTAPANAAWITINPENDSVLNNGNYVSWGFIDDICIAKAVPVPTENRTWGQIKGTYR